jgi:hypothetical protein
MIKFSTNWSKLPLEYVGVCTTIRCTPITYGPAKGDTFISMDGEYTTDCTPGMYPPPFGSGRYHIFDLRTAMIAKGKRRRHEFFDDVNQYFEKLEAANDLVETKR